MFDCFLLTLLLCTRILMHDGCEGVLLQCPPVPVAIRLNGSACIQGSNSFILRNCILEEVNVVIYNKN